MSRRVQVLVVLACLTFLSDPTPAQGQPGIPEALQILQQADASGAIEILEAVTEREPDNARAWMLLGVALQRNKELDRALAVHRKAARFDQTEPRALYNMACVFALQGKDGKAFKTLHRVKETGKVNLTAVWLDPDLATLLDDPRIVQLMPTAAEYADPFVEGGVILQEWVGEAAGDQFGWIARDIGDVDGDGIHDVTTSAPSKDVAGAQAGRVYVYSGATGNLLWQQSGRPGDQLGQGIEAAGDVNADGVPDVIAGAPGGDEAHVYSGRDGKVLMTIRATQEGELLGRKVSDVGDLNGDGHDDVLVGAPNNDETGEDAGRAAVYSGKDGTILAEWYGESAGDNFGSAGGGWVDGEEALIVVGAPNAGPNRGGRVYVYSSSSKKSAFVIEADDTGAQLGGMFVSVVGDVDADGTPDVYGSDWANNASGPSTGRIYVHSGKDGSRLYTLTGEVAGDGFGIGPADAGDVDGDGHDDLVIGAWQHRSAAPSGGKVYLYSGKTGDLIRTWTSQVPGETLGFDATGVGDVDGDGKIDFLLTSAWSAIRGARSGRMFIVSGE